MEKNELENSDTVESIRVQGSKYFQCSNLNVKIFVFKYNKIKLRCKGNRNVDSTFQVKLCAVA